MAHAIVKISTPLLGSLFDKVTGTQSLTRLALDDLYSMVESPDSVNKIEAPCLAAHDCNKKTLQDVIGHNSMTCLWIDIDDTPYGLGQLAALVEMQGITNAVIYSTASSCRLNNTGGINGKRWRIVIPLLDPIPVSEWVIIQTALVAMFDGDSSALRPAQILFLPNNPEITAPGEIQHYEYQLIEGELFNVIPAAIQTVINVQTAELANHTDVAKKALISRPIDSSCSVIEMYNQAFDLASLVNSYGYEFNGHSYKPGNATSGSYGFHLHDDYWVSFHECDKIGQANNSCRYGDAFDLFTFHQHNGNRAAAIKEAANQLDPEGQKDRQREYMESNEASNDSPVVTCVKLDLIPEIEEEKPFPLGALGLLAPAAKAIAEIVQVPDCLAGLSVLSTAALSVQSFYDVEVDGRVCPVSLFGLSVLDSGDRKTATDDLASVAVKEYESHLRMVYKSEYPHYRNELDAYNAERNSIIGSKDKKSQITQSERVEKLNELTLPEAPLEPKIVSTDPTLEGLHKAFLHGRPSLGLFTDEGAGFFGSNGMNDQNRKKMIAGLSKLWGGGDIERTRGGEGESFQLSGRRLSSHIMLQPVIAEEVLGDKLMSGQGFLARFLIISPASLAGTRKYNYKNADESQELYDYKVLMLNLLNRELEVEDDGGLITRRLTLTDEAKALWVPFYNEVESQLGKDGDLDIIKEVANKIAENVLRIAGVLCAVNEDSEITHTHMANALELGGYFLSEQLRLTQGSQVIVPNRNANDLAKWIAKQGPKITLNKITTFGPRAVGAKKGVDHIRSLMGILVKYGHYKLIGYDSNSNPSEWEEISA
jgi:hypothetical protein